MRILVLYGGNSPERDVSLESGSCITVALQERGHDVVRVDYRDIDRQQPQLPACDIAVPMVHGTGGEDGELQRILVAHGIVYVGSSPDASELTFDKRRTNELLHRHGICVPKSVSVTVDLPPQEVRQTAEQLRLPVVVKPTQQGSSVGVSIVHRTEELLAAVECALQYGTECLVEQFVRGREATVPVVEGLNLPPIEIRPQRPWYDYTAKYQDDATQYIVAPSDVPPSIRDTARQACQICGVTGIARVDFIVDEAGQPWLLEINSVPGMTSHSLVPKSAAAIGLTVGELCEHAIRTALNHP